MKVVYFYRKFNSSNFFESKIPLKKIPVRLKNKYFSENHIYDTEKFIWEKSDSIPKMGENSIPVEYVEFPTKPVKPTFKTSIFTQNELLNLEELSPMEMKKFLDYRNDKLRFQYNLENYKDQQGFSKDLVSCKVIIDEINFTLTLSFYKFLRPQTKSSNLPTYSDNLTEIPSFETYSLFFDIKNGLVSYETTNNKKIIITWHEISKNLNNYRTDHIHFITNLKHLEMNIIPKTLLSKVYEIFAKLIEDFTQNQIHPTLEDFNVKKMISFTMLPYEEKLYSPLLSSALTSLKFNLKVNRNSSNIFNNFLKLNKIRNYRILRKKFIERPSVIFTQKILQLAGFSDVNLYIKVLENEKMCDLFDRSPKKSLFFFCKYSIKKRGEIATLNTLGQARYLDLYFNDGLDMFKQFFHLIPSEIKQKILKEGFTEYYHDILAKISYQAKHRKINFKYSEEQKNLQDEIDGYTFALPKSNHQLQEIGATLHNCVASYSDNVKKKSSTIIYAKKEGEYKICIELQGNKIIQEKTNYNTNPQNEDFEVLKKWHIRHKLII